MSVFMWTCAMPYALQIEYLVLLLQLFKVFLEDKIPWWPFNRYDLAAVYHQQSSWGDMLSSCFRSHISTFATFAKGTVKPLGSIKKSQKLDIKQHSSTSWNGSVHWCFRMDGLYGWNHGKGTVSHLTGCDKSWVVENPGTRDHYVVTKNRCQMTNLL